MSKKNNKVSQKKDKTKSEREVLLSRIKALDILIAPHVTEKSISMIEKFNTLTFIVNPSTTKTEIKLAVQRLYDVKVERIRTVNTHDNRKKAFVRLRPEYKAQEIATRLGIL
jgi:large subunit ribosomal protein L23